jgi:endoglucanase
MVSWRILGACAAATSLLVGQSAAGILYAGVNSGMHSFPEPTCIRSMQTTTYDLAAGGEFGQQNLPGTFGVDYQFFNESAINFFLDAGLNTVRIPFLLVSNIRRIESS